MLKNVIAVVLIGVMSCPLYGQTGKGHSFNFLKVPSSARSTALGGVNVSLADQDLNMVYNNPGLASDTLSGYVSFNYLSYFADVNAVSFIYQHDFGKYGSWFIGLNHFDYGNFDAFDDVGSTLGDFDSDETVLFLGRSHQVNRFSFGVSIKVIQSHIAEYYAHAVAADIGGAFVHPTIDLTAGLAFKNMGVVVSDYSESGGSALPFDVQAGVTFKPRHMPFRFSFTGYNLDRGNLIAPPPDGDEKVSTFDQIFGHIVIGTELLVTKNVNLRAGYNHLVRQELKLEEASGSAGFSYGIMFRVKVFEFAYSRGGYHVVGGAHSFTVAANTNLFFRKGKL